MLGGLHKCCKLICWHVLSNFEKVELSLHKFSLVFANFGLLLHWFFLFALARTSSSCFFLFNFFTLWRFVLLCVYILLFILFLFSFLVFFFFFIFFEKVTEWLESPSELPVHSKEYNLNPFITWSKTRNKKFPILSWKKMLGKILRKNAAFICGICPVIFERKLLKENWKNCYAYLTCDQVFFFLAPERGEGEKKEAWHIYLTSLLLPLFCLPVIN